MAADIEQLVKLFKAIFTALMTPINIPFIGSTTPFYIMIFSAAVGWITYFVTEMMGGGGGTDTTTASPMIRGTQKNRPKAPKTSTGTGVFFKRK